MWRAPLKLGHCWVCCMQTLFRGALYKSGLQVPCVWAPRRTAARQLCSKLCMSGAGHIGTLGLQSFATKDSSGSVLKDEGVGSEWFWYPHLTVDPLCIVGVGTGRLGPQLLMIPLFYVWSWCTTCESAMLPWSLVIIRGILVTHIN